MDVPAPGETLLVIAIDIVNAEGRLIMRTVWATTADYLAGPRSTRFEHINDAEQLLARLAELVPAIAWLPQRQPPLLPWTAR
jgi:hypothetical protein